ncbi:transposase [Microvirga vignae]|uniref:Transposase n=1 Tax=Microvirga vignae TaxID=1225564 RepID=A0A0H1RG85_9HYPH|nr:transposase [Microvirga vignae]
MTSPAEVLSFFSSMPPCLIGMEACATSHHWARELIKLGHIVKLMPPAYVKAYVKRGKTDAVDAEAICEAVTRPSMRFVPIKSANQQSVLMLHWVRALLIRQRTMLVNALRGHLAEFGIIVAQGISRIRELIQILTDESADAVLPPLARRALAPLVDQLLDLQPRIRALEAELLAWHRQSQESRRLETIPGVGFIAATVTEPSHLRSGREFVAWLGLTPRPNASGGRERLGRISKMGDGYLRTLLVVGATAVIRYTRARTAIGSAWITALPARKPARLASIALANKMARIAWALLARGDVYRGPVRTAA